MRNNLHGFAKVIAAAFFGDDLLIDSAGGPVVVAAQLGVGEALIMAEVEVGFGAVVSDEDLSVLEGGHGAGIDVQVRIELHQVDLQPATFQQAPDGGRCQSLA